MRRIERFFRGSATPSDQDGKPAPKKMDTGLAPTLPHAAGPKRATTDGTADGLVRGGKDQKSSLAPLPPLASPKQADPGLAGAWKMLRLPDHSSAAQVALKQAKLERLLLQRPDAQRFFFLVSLLEFAVAHDAGDEAQKFLFEVGAMALQRYAKPSPAEQTAMNAFVRSFDDLYKFTSMASWPRDELESLEQQLMDFVSHPAAYFLGLCYLRDGRAEPWAGVFTFGDTSRHEQLLARYAPLRTTPLFRPY